MHETEWKLRLTSKKDASEMGPCQHWVKRDGLPSNLTNPWVAGHDHQNLKHRFPKFGAAILMASLDAVQ